MRIDNMTTPTCIYIYKYIPTTRVPQCSVILQLRTTTRAQKGRFNLLAGKKREKINILSKLSSECKYVPNTRNLLSQHRRES